MPCHTLVCLLGLLSVLSKLYLVWFLKVFACIFTNVYVMACLLSLFQYIGKTPSNPKSAKMCMKFNFISICTYLCGVCPIYCSCLLYTSPSPRDGLLSRMPSSA